MIGSFIAIAALMALGAAAAVAWPLVRDPRSRLVGALAAALVPAAAAGFYALWTNWDWNAPPPAAAQHAAAAAASPEVAAMVARLEQHLQEHPDDLEGWLMLGRSYLSLERLDDAIVAYDHAERLGDGKNLDAILGLGESLSLRAGGEITPQVANLFEAGVTLAPNSAKALLYGGFAAAVRGETALARSRWLSLKALNPPPQVAEMIDQRLAELGPDTGAAPSGTPGAAAAPSATATVALAIAPSLKVRLKADAPLFVFAREPGGKGPPLAVKRLTIGAIGTQIQLSGADSMMPGRGLTKGQRVSITARVAFSGQPLPTSGDLYGELTYEVGRDGVRELLIDQVTP
ncbi:MAG: tetratricopeptide repeat protein [Steroidobacterales bacterium]